LLFFNILFRSKVSEWIRCKALSIFKSDQNLKMSIEWTTPTWRKKIIGFSFSVVLDKLTINIQIRDEYFTNLTFNGLYYQVQHFISFIRHCFSYKSLSSLI
jgi:hypothetical protein